MMDALPFQTGVAALPMLGQNESGDKHLIRPLDGGLLVAVADGLGHGPEASRAAGLAIAELESCALESLNALFQRCHHKLGPTRGAAISMAVLDALQASMTWAGVGNVEGLLLRPGLPPAPARESLVLLSGVVGGHLPPLRPVTVPVFPGDTLVMATDGIRSSFERGISLRGSPQTIASSILAQYKKGTDDALVVVVRYTGGMSPSKR